MASEWDNWFTAYKRTHPSAVKGSATIQLYNQWYDKKHGTNLTGTNPPPEEAAPAAPAAAPPPPAFDPDVVDSQGQTELANMNSKYDLQRLNARTAYNTWMQEAYGADAAVNTGTDANPNWVYDPAKRTGGKMGQIAYDEKQGMRNSMNASAARGMLRSGNKVVNDGKVATGAENQRTALGFDQQRQFNDFNRQTGQANVDQQTEGDTIRTNTRIRRLGQYNQQYGLGS